MGYSIQSASRGITTNNVTITTSSTAAASAAFGSETYQIRIAAPAVCFYKIGDSSTTATNTDTLLPSPWVEYVKVTPGQRISVWSATQQTISIQEAGA